MTFTVDGCICSVYTQCWTWFYPDAFTPNLEFVNRATSFLKGCFIKLAYCINFAYLAKSVLFCCNFSFINQAQSGICDRDLSTFAFLYFNCLQTCRCWWCISP